MSRKACCSLLIALAFSACMDRDLDFRNLDETVKLEVKDLVLSLPIDTIRLGGVVPVKDGNLIRVVRDENGDSVYAVVKEGNFESKPVKLLDEHIVKMEQIIGEGQRLFTGDVEYNFEPFEIPVVNMAGLPSMLKGNGTKISLGEPQLYMELFNPLKPYGARMEAGLRLAPMKGNEKRECTIDDGKLLYTSATDYITTFLMSPEKPMTILEGWGEPLFVKFTDLKYLLLTEHGIPDKIAVEVTEPRLPKQRVVNVPLEKSLGGVEGYYSLYVPLKFCEESVIEYCDTVRFSGKMENALNVKRMKIGGVVSLGMPMDDIEVNIKPLCEGDERAVDKGFAIARNDNEKPFELMFDYGNEPLHNLDGIAFRVMIRVRDDEVLKPSQYVSLKKIKISVDGYYEK